MIVLVSNEECCKNGGYVKFVRHITENELCYQAPLVRMNVISRNFSLLLHTRFACSYLAPAQQIYLLFLGIHVYIVLESFLEFLTI